MLLDLTLRNETPVSLRVALLSMLLIIGLLHSVIPNWRSSIKMLAYLPVQRFTWQSEKYTANRVFRISSIISICTVYAIFIYTHLYSQKLVVIENASVNFLLIWLGIIVLTTFKFALNKYYFHAHRSNALGDLVIDYQYSINQIFAFIIGLVLLIDVFYFRLDSNWFIVAILGVLALFLIKLFGTILMLQNNFSFPIITLFVYLCTFEIVPMLVIAKILFVNS